MFTNSLFTIQHIKKELGMKLRTEQIKSREKKKRNGKEEERQ